MADTDPRRVPEARTPDRPSRPSWTLLTNHGHVLLLVAQGGDARVSDIATRVGITERSTLMILKDLEESGYITRRKVGRRTHYTVDAHQHFRHPPSPPTRSGSCWPSWAQPPRRGTPGKAPPGPPRTVLPQQKEPRVSDALPRRGRRLEGTLSLDGLTVRLQLVGDELVIAFDDPVASIDALTLVDTHGRETVLHRTGLAARTRTRAVVTRMIDVLHDAGSASARAVVARMRPAGDIDSEAVHALSRAVALSGRAEMWGWTMSRVRDSFQLLRLEEPDAILPPFLAVGFADLTGCHGFEREHFEAMTASWRAVVGDLPAEADRGAGPPMLRAG